LDLAHLEEMVFTNNVHNQIYFEQLQCWCVFSHLLLIKKLPLLFLSWDAACWEPFIFRHNL
jgi:hypothetical protein